MLTPAKPLHFQFSVRTALVMMTLAGLLSAASVAVYRAYFGTSKVLTFGESNRIRNGMSEFQVRWEIGPPARAARIRGTDSWSYALEAEKGTTNSEFCVEFGTGGRVSGVNWSGTVANGSSWGHYSAVPSGDFKPPGSEIPPSKRPRERGK